jgi:hypothetical protein
LLRSGARARAALCDPTGAGPASEPPPFWAFEVEGLPVRLVSLARRTPGLRLFRPSTDRILIAAGYRHPLHLERCALGLVPDRMVFLEPPPLPSVEVEPPPAFVSLEDLAKLPTGGPGASVGASAATRTRARRAHPPLSLRLTLQPARTDPGRVRGTLIEPGDRGRLVRLLYGLPPRLLGELRAALVGDDLLILSPERIEAIPLGAPLIEPAPFVLIPAGTALSPRLPPERLAEHLGGGDGRYCVVRSVDRPTYVVSQRDLAPLEGWIALQLPQGSSRPGAPPIEPSQAPVPPRVVHDPVGLFPLWGLVDPARARGGG